MSPATLPTTICKLVAAAVLLGTFATVHAADEEPGVSLTVYNNNLAVVKERRQIKLAEQVSQIRFTDVAKQIDPTSVIFKSLTDPNTSVIEQNYEYDLVSADKLLDRYIDKSLAVMTEDGSRYAGRLLSFDAGQLVIKGREQLYRASLIRL